MSKLGAFCACGHTANYHRTDAQQRFYLDHSGGRHPGECEGAAPMTPHCRCIASREAVQEDA